MSLPRTESHYQLFHDLPEKDFLALKDSIREHGVLVPVEVDEHGAPLDGHHRIRAWSELRAEGVKVPDYPRLVRVGMSDGEKRVHVRSLNMLRRHLSKDQLRQHWVAMRRDGATLQAIADASGVPKSTVHDAIGREEFSETGKLTGKDGKSYPMRKPRAPKVPTTVVAKNKRETDRAVAAAESGIDLQGEVVDVKRAEKAARDHAAKDKQQAQMVSAALHETSCQLIPCDIRNLHEHIEAESVDIILTDPPYSKEFLHVYNDLARAAVHCLKPGGSLLVMVGQSYLDLLLQRVVVDELHYHWMLAYLTPGGQSAQIWQRQVNTFWKPVLWFVKSKYRGEWVGDVARSAPNDNESNSMIGGNRKAV